MDDTTSITPLEMISISLPRAQRPAFGWISGLWRWCVEAVEDQQKSRTRKELAKEVFRSEDE